MSIASAIQTKQQQIADAYTAVDNKGGTLPATQNLTNLATAIGTITTGGSSPVINSLNVTPSTSAQTITVESGVDGYGPVNVSAVTSSIDANITAGNIKNGVTILGVTGSAVELNATTENITPTTSSQTITPTSPYNGFSSVTVSAVTSSIDANITAGNIKNGVKILGVTGNYQGSGGGSGTGTRDVPLTRITDDNNNEIGTWYMNFADANGNEYKVVLLDAQYRAFATQWCSNSGAVTNMPLYSSLKTANVWEAKDTATANTQLILDYCTANDYTSNACSHCRAQSFTIGGTTYYGQLPNTVEMTFLARHYNEFDSLDTSASSETSKNFSTTHTFWASSQYDNANGWGLYHDGNIDYGNKAINYYACPVLEIPVV